MVGTVCPFGGGEILQHVRRRIFTYRPAADADAHSAEVGGAQRMTPPISNHAGIQTLSRRHQLAKCSGHNVNATAEPTDRELTRSYPAVRDGKLGFTVTRVARQSSVGDRTQILGTFSATSFAGSTKGSSNSAKTPVFLLALVQSGCSTYCRGWRFEEPALPLTSVCQIGHRSRVGRGPHAAAPKRPAGSGPAPGRRH